MHNWAIILTQYRMLHRSYHCVTLFSYQSISSIVHNSELLVASYSKLTVDNSTSWPAILGHPWSIHSQVDTRVSNRLDGVDIGVFSNWCDEELLSCILGSAEQNTLPTPLEKGSVTLLPFIPRYGPEFDLMVYLPIGIAMAWCNNCNYPQYSKQKEIPANC